MAKLSVGQKAHRVLDFLVGLGHKGARRALAEHGLTAADLDEGWKRLRALSEVALEVDVEPDPPGEPLLPALDAWENKWFPIIDVVLRLHAPDVHERVFRNLRQTEGPEVIVSVSTLLDRLDGIALPEREGGFGERGREARALLEKRGLNEAVVGRARALLARFRTPEEATEEDGFDREARRAAEARLWDWYIEWSTLARSAIRDRRTLRSLGFLRGGRNDGEAE